MKHRCRKKYDAQISNIISFTKIKCLFCTDFSKSDGHEKFRQSENWSTCSQMARHSFLGLVT
jgi:hypothetical protein